MDEHMNPWLTCQEEEEISCLGEISSRWQNGNSNVTSISEGSRGEGKSLTESDSFVCIF